MVKSGRSRMDRIRKNGPAALDSPNKSLGTRKAMVRLRRRPLTGPCTIQSACNLRGPADLRWCPSSAAAHSAHKQHCPTHCTGHIGLVGPRPRRPVDPHEQRAHCHCSPKCVLVLFVCHRGALPAPPDWPSIACARAGVALHPSRPSAALMSLQSCRAMCCALWIVTPLV